MENEDSFVCRIDNVKVVVQDNSVYSRRRQLRLPQKKSKSVCNRTEKNSLCRFSYDVLFPIVETKLGKLLRQLTKKPEEWWHGNKEDQNVTCNEKMKIKTRE